MMTITGLQAQDIRQPEQARLAFESGEQTADQVVQAYLDHYTHLGIQKCTTPLWMFIHEHESQLSAPTLEKARLANPAGQIRQRMMPDQLSPSGKFTIFYETTGADAVPAQDDNTNGIPDYVEWVATAMDSSYQHEVVTLGYTDPIPAGQSYEVYLSDIAAYGFTQTDPGAPGGTFIVIENDFDGFPGNEDPDGDQRGAIRVTAAHEFKHAIQFVQNNWSGETDLWAEMDATLYEEVVYDEVNDYYNYMIGFGSSIFQEPTNTLIPGSYEDASFALFFEEKYGSDFWVQVWDRIEANPTGLRYLDATKNEVEARGDNFEALIAENYIWHFATGPFYSVAGFGFEESESYPIPGVTVTRDYTSLPETLSPSFDLNRFSAQFMEIQLANAQDGFISIEMEYPVPTIQLGVIAYFKNGSSDTRFVSASSSGFTEIITSWNWKSIERMGVVAVNTDQFSSQSYRILFKSIERLGQNYPNPFNPITTIPVSITTRESIHIELYDVIGRKVRTIVQGTYDPGVYEFPFDAKDLATGIYIYKLTTPDGTYIRKMALVK